MASFFDLKARKAAAANGASTQKQAKSAKNTAPQPWVEKYRPKTLSDVAAQDHTTTVLQKTLQASNLPHMLFYGPPGTGKTSTILALAKELFGPEMIRARVLELNASDERGISIVREKVKDFARMQLTHPPPGYQKRYPCPPFKIIVLDEADSMTQDAQSALRRTMETYSKITRFCLICNYVTRIIDPLASRCSKFRFKSLDPTNTQKRLENIALQEGVPLEDGAVDALIKCSDGDLRKAITFLQSAAKLVGAKAPTSDGEESSPQTKSKDTDGDGDEEMDDDAANGRTTTDPIPPVTVRIIEEIAGVIPDETIDNLFAAMKPSGSRFSFAHVSKIIDSIVADGWSAVQVVSQLYQRIVYDEAVADCHKNEIVEVFSQVDKRLVDGSDEHLALLDLTLRVATIMKHRD